MRLRARRERLPSGRAARPRPRALLGFHGERGFPPRCIDQRSSGRWFIARSAHFRLVASTSARLADGVSRGAHIEPRDVRVAAPFGEKAACDRPCSLHALEGGNCKLAGTLPRSESSCHFVFGCLRSVTSSPVRQCTRSRCRRPWMHGGVGYLDAESITAESIVALARLAESISKDVITFIF